MSSQLPLLPVDQPSFRNLRQKGYIYVDKTRHVYNLINGGRCFFLNRPPTFGKSLLVSTLSEVLAGNRSLFQSLWIGTSDYDWHPHGVIKLDFSALNVDSIEALSKSLSEILAKVADDYQLAIETRDIYPGLGLQRLVYALHERFGKVALLIDNYDSPGLRKLPNPTEARAFWDDLCSFFAVVKSLGAYLDFVLLTGVTELYTASIWGGMNHLQSLTMRKEAADICGYTEAEIEVFRGHIQVWADQNGIGYDEQKNTLRTWYGGYRFSERELHVYSPVSFMKALEERALKNFWLSTTPVFLVDQLKKEQNKSFSAFKSILKNKPEILGSYHPLDIGEMSLRLLMLQTGYWTVIDYDKLTHSYDLYYPNHEVEQSMQHLISTIIKSNSTSSALPTSPPQN